MRLRHAGQFRAGNKPWNRGLTITKVTPISSYHRPTEDQDSLYVNRDRKGNIIQNDIETLNEVGTTMVLRHTKLQGSRIARFIGEKTDSDEVEGYRMWHAKTAVHACVSAQRHHDKIQTDCKGLVRVSARKEQKKGLTTSETLVCDECNYESPHSKFYGVVPSDEPGKRGPKVAEPNMAAQVAMFNSPIGPQVLREVAAALDISVPTTGGLQNLANKYSDKMVSLNEKDMEALRETVKEVHAVKGNEPDSGIPIEADSRYQSPLRSGRGKKPGQPSGTCVTNVAENVTKRKWVICTHVKNKNCQQCSRGEGKKEVPSHKCSANIPQSAVIGDERQAAIEIAKKLMSGPSKTIVAELTEDGDSSFSSGMKEVMEEAGLNDLKVFKDIVHLSKAIRRKVSGGKWSKQMFPGKTQEERKWIRDRFGNDLAIRLNTEHVLGLKKFRNQRVMAGKMKQAMQAIPYCYSGDHSRCKSGSLVCRHPYKWKFQELQEKAKGKLDPTDADLKELGKIMEHRLGKEALKVTRRGRTTNKVESVNRQISKTCPKNVNRSRTFPGRVHSGLHSSNNGTGMSIARKRAAANIPLSLNSAVVPTLERMGKSPRVQAGGSTQEKPRQ